MALYIRWPRRDEVRISRGLPKADPLCDCENRGLTLVRLNLYPIDLYLFMYIYTKNMFNSVQFSVICAVNRSNFKKKFISGFRLIHILK